MNQIKHVQKIQNWFKKTKLITLTALICASMLYGKMSNADNISFSNLFISSALAAEQTTCAPNNDRITHLKSASQGFFTKMRFAEKAYDLGDIAFTDSTGQEKHLSDFKGKVLLVNFWALWCPPCREEMPELAKLKKALQSDDFNVVTINLDKSSDEKIMDFLKEIGADNLELYRDGSMKSFDNLRRNALAFGLPSTVLIDENSCVLASYNGSAPWNDADSKALMKAAIETKANDAKTGEVNKNDSLDVSKATDVKENNADPNKETN